MGSAAPNPGPGNRPPDLTMDLNPNFYTQFALGLQFLPASVKGFFVLGKICLEQFLTLFSLPLEVYLRWRWGSRAMGAFQVYSLGGLALLSLVFGNLFLSLFFIGVAGLGVWHYFEARRWETRNPAGPRWRLTYSFGEPVVWFAIVTRLTRRGLAPRWGGVFTIFRFLEPATGITLGTLLALVPFTRFLGYVLLVSGVTLLVKRHLIYLRHVDETRDRRDAVAISEMLGTEADSAGRIASPTEVFEVRLAVPAPRQVIPLPSGLAPPPRELTPLPSVAPTGRVVRGPDASNRVVVECPHCTREIRCSATRSESGVTCPNCTEEFVFAHPVEAVS